MKRFFETDEWYHCFNRGIDKRDVFDNEYDANRFLMALYLANGTRPIQLYNLQKPDLASVLKVERGAPLVSIGAYCLMPNHFHLLIKERGEGGITSFMRKVGTAYAMYFNVKNDRVGNLFLRPFRSRHISTDRYFQRALQYVHCNPAELYEPGWKKGIVRNIGTLEKKLLEYPYSSLSAFVGAKQRSPIIAGDVFEIARHPKIATMLAEAREYYADVKEELDR